MKQITLYLAIITTQISCMAQNKPKQDSSLPVQKTEAEWKAMLTDEEYRILREKGTERPFTGEYTDHHEQGVYTCKACGNKLFLSDHKFDSHCGWPSFYQSADSTNVHESVDLSHGMKRIEITCSRCGGHLGHVFDDGPTPTGLRYCINSASLKFQGIQNLDR